MLEEIIDTNTVLATASAFALISGSIYLVHNRNNNDSLFRDLINNLKHLKVHPDNNQNNNQKNNQNNNQNNNQKNKSAKIITNFFRDIKTKPKSQDKNSLDESMLIVGKGLDTIKEAKEVKEVKEGTEAPSGCYI